MKRKARSLLLALALSLLGQPSLAGSWNEIVVEADPSYRLYVDMASIHAVQGLGDFLERKEFAGPQRAPDGKQAYTRVDAEVVVNCQEEMLAYTGATFYSMAGKAVGRTRLPPASWHFINPSLGSGGNQEIEVVCASLDSRYLNQPHSPF